MVQGELRQLKLISRAVNHAFQRLRVNCCIELEREINFEILELVEGNVIPNYTVFRAIVIQCLRLLRRPRVCRGVCAKMVNSKDALEPVGR